MSRVLVYQANGVQGSATLRHVLQAGFTARALLRSTSKAAELTSRGVEVAVADLTDREGLIRAHQSVDHVVMQIPAYGDAFVKTAVENAVCAMQVARVGGVILKMSNPTSSHATPDSGFSANGIVRKAMQSAGIEFSAVEPTMYLDTFLKPNLRREISEHQLIDLPIANGLKIAWTTVDDAARLSACLLQARSWGLTVRCAGEVAYDGQELAAIFSGVLGQRISYRSTDLKAFQRDLESAIGAAGSAPVIAKFRFLSQFPDEARRMLSIPARGPSVADNFAPTFLPDWIRKNRASFARES
jgi:uncharacterized protein YbjT (DUF2867 family)